MNLNAADPRGRIIQSKGAMRIDNALVEEVSTQRQDRNTGFLVISYAAPMPNGMTSIELLRLNVSGNTVILNPLGMPMCLCDIRKGMWINTVFSTAMTRSIPPQSSAFLIMVKRRPASSTDVTIDRVAMVDAENRFLYTGNPNNPNRQMRFVITRNTVILGRNGIPVPLTSIRPGQLVRITHANFQTASIPPQTTAFYIQLL